MLQIEPIIRIKSSCKNPLSDIKTHFFAKFTVMSLANPEPFYMTNMLN